MGRTTKGIVGVCTSYYYLFVRPIRRTEGCTTCTRTACTVVYTRVPELGHNVCTLTEHGYSGAQQRLRDECATRYIVGPTITRLMMRSSDANTPTNASHCNAIRFTCTRYENI
uniref:Uncharacterized protein n=1 Tax=Sipha flava TaxID=143950 RepID=A0A2S2PXJ3_9HEMI